jgi:hypothetical protein
VALNTYRIYFFGDRAISGRHDFDAENDPTALQMAHALSDACPDSCQSFDLWRGERRVPRTYRETSFAEMSAANQQAVIETEETLAQSRWSVAKSRRLLERLEAEGLATSSQGRVLNVRNLSLLEDGN